MHFFRTFVPAAAVSPPRVNRPRSDTTGRHNDSIFPTPNLPIISKSTSKNNPAVSSSALIVCVYEEPVVPEQAATVTEKLGEYLISVGY